MSDSLNNKELVAVGHQFAKAMSSDTPIIDMAKIVSRLAERLDCTTAALRKMTKKRDAEHTDVLVWEKTMFKVCGEDGPKSVADKFAELQAKCAALAAENARCKFEVSRCHQTVDEMFKNRDKWIDKEWLSSIWSTSKRLMEETPAIDAFLAEVRAQGADECVRQLVISNDDDFSDAPNVCAMVAHQLRQEVNTENPSMLSDEDCQAFVQAFTKGAAQ
ncbi:MAG: hypothetical protein E7A42_12660 [Leclercia adecarboxylata]|nr:hypothetical protein [Leclercia adecarboxylata]